MLTLPHQFFLTAERYANKPALRWKSGDEYRDLTYAQVAQAVRAVAAAFLQAGLRPHDRVALLSENRPEWVMADLGIMLAGGVVVPIHTTFSARLAAAVLADSGSRFLVASSADQLDKVAALREELPHLEKVISLELCPPSLPANFCRTWDDFLEQGRRSGIHSFPRVNPRDVCSILYTSGTTGEPKGVTLTHDNFQANAHAALQAIPMNDRDVLLSFLPLSHVFERLGGYYAPVVGAGGTVAFARSVKDLAKNLLEVRPTILIAVPRLFEKIHETAWQTARSKGSLALKLFRWAFRQRPGTPGHFLADRLVFRRLRARFGGRLRFAISGGAALSPELAHFFARAGIPILEGYGMTETSPVISVNRVDRNKVGTVGLPLEGVKVRLAGDGEILIQGPNLTPGYWGKPEATRELIDREGWLHTGDLGFLDDDGFLTISGRKKEILVTAAGKNVWPDPIERKLEISPFIAQSMVVGDGQIQLGALIVPEWEALEPALRELGLDPSARETALADARVRELFRREIDQTTADVAEYERIARFALLPREFSQDREEITPTMKKSRKVIAEHFRQDIESLYPARKIPH
ncbi:MAG: long-chain fatty acid--CoA ligase [Candidatus Zixiibacteriota bacterium]|nr:MAG: long-chain fatty acid--CoA ligase [candidate division Zixibacteria bacterium]